MSCNKKRIKQVKICSADLRHRIELYTRSLTASNSGISRDYTYTLIKQVWSAIETVTGEITFKGIATLEATTHYFYIRYRADINSEIYIKFKDKYYNILKVENLSESDSYLKLYVSLMGVK